MALPGNVTTAGRRLSPCDKIFLFTVNLWKKRNTASIANPEQEEKIAAVIKVSFLIVPIIGLPITGYSLALAQKPIPSRSG